MNQVEAMDELDRLLEECGDDIDAAVRVWKKWEWENEYRPEFLRTCLRFSKEKPENQVWEVSNDSQVGELLFSFDGKNIYNLWVDYPHNFTKEQKKIFDKEQPYWAKFFRHRSKKPKKKDLEYMEYERKSCPYLIRDTDPEWDKLQKVVAEIKSMNTESLGKIPNLSEIMRFINTEKDKQQKVDRQRSLTAFWRRLKGYSS